jgi:hypothetical protein
MVKATKVFKSDDSGDSSLSFPFSPVPFKKGDLDFASGDLTNEQALSVSEFSRIVNLIPEGIFWDSAERYLWREYQDVLYGSVKLASSIRSPEAEADYQKALQVLRMVKGNGAMQDTPAVVAYVHQTRQEDFALCGGMCVDERAYRRFPRWLFEAVREQGGLATIVTRDSVEMLGEECVAVFGHVGEPRARAADLRTGFVDTDREHLMVIWRRDLSEDEKKRLLDRVEALGPF